MGHQRIRQQQYGNSKNAQSEIIHPTFAKINIQNSEMYRNVNCIRIQDFDILNLRQK